MIDYWGCPGGWLGVIHIHACRLGTRHDGDCVCACGARRASRPAVQ